MISQRLSVDDEVFEVEMSGTQHQYHYTWVSGRNPGYGFSSVTSDGPPLTAEQHAGAIRDFLAAVDPTTDYLTNTDDA